jgi:periplasmic divalent cation tolerance protein
MAPTGRIARRPRPALRPARDLRIVLVAAPAAAASRIARDLVVRGLAACVNVVPGVRSTFRWRGKVDSARESLLLAKTVRGRLPDLIPYLTGVHPYDVPEILVLRAESGLPSYLAWAAESCGRVGA